MTAPVCVTGMGCVSAAGIGTTATWASLCEGRQHRVFAEQLHKDALPYPYFAAPTNAYGTPRTFSTKDTVQLARIAAEQALQAAGLPVTAQQNLAIVIGTTAGSALHFLDGYAAARTLAAGTHADIDAYFTSNVALVLAHEYRSSGITLTVANACTSGADAIGLAATMIQQGQCDAALCGGADALSLIPHTGFVRLMIYSPEPCRPFDAQRQGLNLGEGAGMLLLESAAHAKARNARILGYVAGYGSAADAHHFTAPHPEARGLHTAVEHAMNNAQIGSKDLAFINAHGTATQENDAVEGRFFIEAFPDIPVWGSKSVTGHTLGAAGALEAIFCLLALQHGSIPPTWGFTTPQETYPLCPTTRQTPIHNRYALSTSLAFGGGNAALILAGENR